MAESGKRGAQEKIRQILKPISGIRDRKMRFLLLKEKLSGCGPILLAEMSNIILERAERGEALFKEALLLLVEIIERNTFDYETVIEIYNHAASMGWDGVKSLLRSAPAMKEPRPEDKIHPDVDLGRKTLGERKWMARSLDRFLLDRLLYDPDPPVIANLLRNPRITEADVVKAAARRPNCGPVLEEIFRSERWITRYRIRRVLVLNPYTPTEISLKLVTLLMKADLEIVAAEKSLHPLVREAASRRLAGKKRGNKPPA